MSIKNNTPAGVPYDWNDIMYVKKNETEKTTGEVVTYLGQQCVKVSPNDTNTVNGLEFAFDKSEISNVYSENREFYVEAEAFAESGCEIVFNTNKFQKDLVDKEGDFSSVGIWTKLDYFNSWGYDRVNLRAKNLEESIYVKTYNVYEKVSDKAFSDMKLPRDMVLNPEDIANLSFRDDWGAGATFTDNVVKFKKGILNEEKGTIEDDSKITFTLPEKIDLSQYKVNLTYKLDENCSGYFIVTTNCTPENGGKFGDLTKANQSVTYENIFDGFTGNLETISFQAHPGSTENNPTMTLEKIEFLVK